MLAKNNHFRIFYIRHLCINLLSTQLLDHGFFHYESIAVSRIHFNDWTLTSPSIAVHNLVVTGTDSIRRCKYFIHKDIYYPNICISNSYRLQQVEVCKLQIIKWKSSKITDLFKCNVGLLAVTCTIKYCHK